MKLNLINSRHNFGRLKDGFEVIFAEIGHPDGLGAAGGVDCFEVGPFGLKVGGGGGEEGGVD